MSNAVDVSSEMGAENRPLDFKTWKLLMPFTRAMQWNGRDKHLKGMALMEKKMREISDSMINNSF